MANETLIPVNIVVADRNYRLKIRAEEEEQIRRIMRDVNQKILEFKSSYAGKDLQDYIAMCLITYATQPADMETAPLPPDIHQRLEALESQLDQALK